MPFNSPVIVVDIVIAGVLVLVATVPANPLALTTLALVTPTAGGVIQEVTPLPSVLNR